MYPNVESIVKILVVILILIGSIKILGKITNILFKIALIAVVAYFAISFLINL